MAISKCGDNKNSCHLMKDLINEKEHLLSYCVNCKRRYYVRPADKKTYNKVYKRDALQPSSNLYYKYYGKMNTI